MRKTTPYFEVGDTVEVHCKITEGDKTRIQLFAGTVIARTGGGMGENFTVRRIVNDEGVERVFPLNSPNVVDVKPIQSGKVRRSKLFFLRKRVGKSVRLHQRHTTHTTAK
jgi:large subunit ribosomal protein L19